MEPFPAPRATRFLLLQKGQLMRSDLTVLNAQMFNLRIERTCSFGAGGKGLR